MLVTEEDSWTKEDKSWGQLWVYIDMKGWCRGTWDFPFSLVSYTAQISYWCWTRFALVLPEVHRSNRKFQVCMTARKIRTTQSPSEGSWGGINWGIFFGRGEDSLEHAQNLINWLIITFIKPWGGKGKGIHSKLEGVGPVDNRPSTDKLHHFVWKKKYIIVT